MALRVVTNGAARRLREHIRTPLHRDGYALALSSGLTAVTGLVYWIVAANEYRPHAIGVNSALISSMMFLAGMASLNLPNILVRFLPEAGPRTARLVASCYAATGTLALAATAVFLLGSESWAPFLHGNRTLQLWFMLSALGWCVFAIQDAVLTALGRAVWVPVENAGFSLLKLGLLPLLVALSPVYGIFVSWTIAMLVAVVAVNAAIFRRLARPAVAEASEAIVSLRDRAFRRYFAADYVCSIAWVSVTNLMPVVVTAAAGATTNAYYALGWAVALPLYAVAANFGTSLVLHGTTDPASLGALTRKAAIGGAQVLVPVVVVILATAPYLLSMFGGAYSERSATLLRLLALATLPYLVLVLAVSVARVRRRLRPAVMAMAAQAALTLLLVTPLLDRFGVTGAGVAWLVSLSAVAGALLVAWWRDRRLGGGESPAHGVAVGALGVERWPDAG
jgi:O-antigen/teichoic acid export membrane protein